METQLPKHPIPHESISYRIRIPAGLFFTIATLAVLARLYVRVYVRPQLGADDYTILVAYAITVFGFASSIVQCNYGIGSHIYDLTADQVMKAAMWSQLSQLQYIVAFGLTKISICLFVLRILERVRKSFRIFTWGVLVFCCMGNLALFIVWFVQCRPIQKLWIPTLGGTCISRTAVIDTIRVSTAFNLITDVICALFPIMFFHNSSMRRRFKGVLALLASLGLLICVASGLKYLYVESQGDESDQTWSITNLTAVVVTEQYAGLALASCATLKPLYTQVFDIVQSYRSGSRTGRSWENIGTTAATANTKGQDSSSNSDSVYLTKIVTPKDGHVEDDNIV